MPYKDILVIADAEKTAPVRLDVAATVAAAQQAHLVALHVMEKPYTPAAVAVGFPSALIEWQEGWMKERADNAKKAVEDAKRRNGIDFEWRAVRGETTTAAMLNSRYSDLVVVSQNDEEHGTSAEDLPESLIMGSGRPTLIVPCYGKFPTVGKRVLVAWSRTRESTRAVHDAMPFLTAADSVTVMEVNPKSDDPHIAGADIALHLARHGVKAEVASITAEDIDVSDIILSRAADLGIDLIVTGAYGHSRLREYTLGGVTLQLLRHMTVPVLMSH